MSSLFEDKTTTSDYGGLQPVYRPTIPALLVDDTDDGEFLSGYIFGGFAVLFFCLGFGCVFKNAHCWKKPVPFKVVQPDNWLNVSTCASDNSIFGGCPTETHNANNWKSDECSIVRDASTATHGLYHDPSDGFDCNGNQGYLDDAFAEAAADDTRRRRMCGDTPVVSLTFGEPEAAQAWCQIGQLFSCSGPRSPCGANSSPSKVVQSLRDECMPSTSPISLDNCSGQLFGTDTEFLPRWPDSLERTPPSWSSYPERRLPSWPGSPETRPHMRRTWRVDDDSSPLSVSCREQRVSRQVADWQAADRGQCFSGGQPPMSPSKNSSDISSMYGGHYSSAI